MNQDVHKMLRTTQLRRARDDIVVETQEQLAEVRQEIEDDAKVCGDILITSCLKGRD